MERNTTSSKGLLAVSFGTSYAQTRRRTIEAIESGLGLAFPERRLYRAWTSGMIRKKLEKPEKIRIFSVQETLEQMAADGVSDLLVQPTHLLSGEEFERARETVLSHAGRFDALSMGEPLLAHPGDAAALAGTLEGIYGRIPEGELLVLMGHGSACLSFPAYELLAQQLRQDGFDRICIGTVEFDPGIAPVLARIRQERPRRVHLAPLLVVAGDHALNDMAGQEPDSWKNQIAREGCQVVCHVNGLGEYDAVRALYVEHARRARPVKAGAGI